MGTMYHQIQKTGAGGRRRAMYAAGALALLCVGAQAATPAPAPAPPYGLPTRAVTWQGESWRQSSRQSTTVLVRPNARIGEPALSAVHVLASGRVRCSRWIYGGNAGGAHQFSMQQQDRRGSTGTAAQRLALCANPAPRGAVLGEVERAELAFGGGPTVQTVLGAVKIAMFSSPDTSQGPRVTVITW